MLKSNSWIVASIFIFLVLFVFHTQTVAQGISRSPNALPSRLLCQDGSDPKYEEPVEVVPSCPSGNAQTSDFITPCQNNFEESTTPCSVNGFAYPKDRPQGWGGLINKVYTSRANGQTYSIQTSGDKHLIYQLRSNGIAFIQDTTWANTEMCTDGTRAYQRIYNENGSLGATLFPLSISCGQLFSSTGQNRAFSYSVSQSDPARDTVLRSLPEENQCSNRNGNTGSFSSTNTLMYHGPARCGAFQGNVMVIRNTSGSGSGEVSIYCKDKGLCAWYQEIDWGAPGTDPRTWNSSTELCAGFKKREPYCETTCSTNNKTVKLSANQAILRYLLKDNQGGSIDFSVQSIRPADGDHQGPDKSSWLYKNSVTEALLPYNFNVIEPGAEISDPTKINIYKNTLQTARSTRFAFDKAETEKSPGTTAYTKDFIRNNTDDSVFSVDNDNNKILTSGLIPKTEKNKQYTKITKNTDSGDISLAKPQELIPELYVPETQDKPRAPIVVTQERPVGENIPVFTSGNILRDIPAVITAGLIEGFLKLINAGNEQQILNQLEGLGISTTIRSCTATTDEKGYVERARSQTDGTLPWATTKLLATIPSDGEGEGKFTSALTQADNSTMDVTINNYAAHETDERYCAQLRASLPRQVLYKAEQYVKNCTNSTVGKSSNTTNALSGMYKTPTLASQCSLSEQTIDKLAKRLGNGQGEFRGYFYGEQEGQRAENYLRNYWGYIQDKAVSYGLNPILAFTFLIEESGVGGFPNAALVGCNYERGTGAASPKGFSAQTVDQQMRCLSQYVKEISSFDSLLCVYAGEKQDDGTYNCNRTFTRNPNFPGMIRFWRDEIIRFTPGLNNSCKIPELDNYTSAIP